jgi:hypothetical protein
VSNQTLIQEIKPQYLISFKREKATFIWSSSPENPIKSSIDLKIKTKPSEITWLAKTLGIPSQNGKLTPSNLDAYNRLLLYTCIRSTIKNPDKARNLAFLILEINSWDALYWASRIRELWWKSPNPRNLTKVAKAFKLFFGLE